MSLSLDRERLLEELAAFIANYVAVGLRDDERAAKPIVVGPISALDGAIVVLQGGGEHLIVQVRTAELTVRR